jgi:ABC-type branched-subunit amino acid transport system permease subunit
MKTTTYRLAVFTAAAAVAGFSGWLLILRASYFF